MKKITMKKTAAAAAAAVMMLAGIPAVNAGAASSSTYSSNTPYYSNTTNLYYSTLDEALRATKGYYANGVYYGYNYGYSSAYPYYSSKTGYYYATYQDALTASGGVSSYVSRVVSNSNVNYVSAYSSSYPYYSSLTGKYYATYSDAVSDSGNRSDVVYYMYGSYNPYYYGYYGYYPYYSSYYTPYYYTTYNTRTTTSSTNAADGVPYAYGNKKYWGWTNLASAINRLKSGSAYAIEMNGATLVPTEVLKVAKQRDITLQLVLANGVIWNIYGGNISSTDEVDLGISYDTSAVPKELISAAKKSNNAVSVAQISVGSGSTGSLGLAGKASVKFSSKRANCFVKVYLYDDAEGNLKLVDKTIVDSKGRAQITVRYSGNYLLVLS